MVLKRVHLIYPHGPQINCPEAIGRNLAARLAKKYEVTSYHWALLGKLKPDPEAALIGHPHPSPLTLFRRSAAQYGWGRVLMLAPYNGEARQMAWYEPALRHADEFLAITGPYWAKRVAKGPLARWQPRMHPLDLAVDRGDFPRVKRRFNPPGKRRFLYIGYAGWPKNTDYLSKLALRLPGWDFGWLGAAKGPAIPGLKRLGRVDFATAAAKKLVAGYDFMITVGSADANPATILEAMAWGLLPVCSPQSGYEGKPGIVNVPLDDVEGALKVLRGLQAAPDAVLRKRVAANDAALKAHYHWDRFAKDVEQALKRKSRRPLRPAGFRETLSLAWHRHTGPNRPWRLRWLGQALYQRLKPGWRAARIVKAGR
jgi:hypothetical protein